MAADIAMVDIDLLVPTYTKENNPNQMPPEDFNALLALMKAKGVVQSIFLTKQAPKKKGGKVLYKVHDGHHRLWAAQMINEEYPGRIPQVPAMVYNSKGEAEAAMIGLGLNRIRGEQDIARAGQVVQELIKQTNASIETAALLTGFKEEELEILTQTSNEVTEELLDELEESGMGSTDEDDVNTKPFVLEISFASKEKYQLARRKLRKAAGKSKDLAVGLLSLLGEEDAD